jgi:hypothetical protein
LEKVWFGAIFVLSGTVTSIVAGSQVARLHGIGVLVGVFTAVLVGMGVFVEVGTLGTVLVGDASKATRVNSAATVWAA